MTDLLTRIEEQPHEVLDVIARSMSIRAAEPAMQSICANYLGKISVPDAHVLEVGCGRGAATMLIMQHLKPARLIGIDLSSLFISLANETFKDTQGRRSSVVMRRQPGSQTPVSMSSSHIRSTPTYSTQKPPWPKPGGSSNREASSSSLTAISQLLASHCSMAIRCNRLWAWCCGIWCTHPTSCGGFRFSSLPLGFAYNRWNLTVTCRRRAPTTSSLCSRAGRVRLEGRAKLGKRSWMGSNGKSGGASQPAPFTGPCSS